MWSETEANHGGSADLRFLNLLHKIPTNLVLWHESEVCVASTALLGDCKNAKFSDTGLDADISLTDSHTVDHQLVWATFCVPALSSSPLRETSQCSMLPCISKTLASSVTGHQIFQDWLVKHTRVLLSTSPLLDVNEVHNRVTDIMREGQSLFFVDKAERKPKKPWVSRATVAFATLTPAIAGHVTHLEAESES